MKRPERKEALGRLLGPAGPEVGCDVCFDALDQYVELEMAGRYADAAIPPGLRAHLEGAPPAARSTRASTRSPVASRLCNPLKHGRPFPGAARPGVRGAIGSATPLQVVAVWSERR